MCGIVAFWDKSGGHETPTGQVILAMLEALACRGPDSAGIALIGPEPQPEMAGTSGRSGSRRPTPTRFPGSRPSVAWWHLPDAILA